VAFVTRRRPVWAASMLGLAVLLKQFALVALPFLALMLLAQETARPTLKRAGAVFVGIVLVGLLPFFVADPAAFWHDTIAYGAGTYRIVGYGFSSLLLRAHLVSRYGYYPFAILVLLVWLPVTVWLPLQQRRDGRLWTGMAAFAISIFVLVFVARVFQTSYLVWPFTGVVLAALLAAAPLDQQAGRRLRTSSGAERRAHETSP
jgi:uncharacterized membrane protein